MTVEARFSEKTADSKSAQSQNIEAKVWQEIGDTLPASSVKEIARLDVLPNIKVEVPVQQAAQGPFATLESGRTALWYEEMRQDYKLPGDATKAQVEKTIRDTRWAKEDSIIRERNGGKLPSGDGRMGDALDQARIGIWYEDMAKQHGLPLNAKRELIGAVIADSRWKQEDAVIRMRNGGVLPPREQPAADDRLAGLYDSKEDFHYADWLSQYFAEQKIKDEKAQEDLRAIILMKKRKPAV